MLGIKKYILNYTNRIKESAYIQIFLIPNNFISYHLFKKKTTIY